MKRECCLVLSFLFSLIPSFAQQGSFYKIYPFVDESYFVDIDTTHDGGYIVCGYTYGPNGGDLMVVRTDSVGSELWRFQNNEYESDSTYLFSNNSTTLMETLDHNFIIAGTINENNPANNSDLLIIKLDSNGGLVWNKKYNFSKIDNPSTLLNDVHSNFYMLANKYPNFQPILIKFNGNGDTIFSKPIILPQGFRFNSVKMFEKNNFIYTCGISDSSLTTLGNLIIKSDTLGNYVIYKSNFDTLLLRSLDVTLTNNGFEFLNCKRKLGNLFATQIRHSDFMGNFFDSPEGFGENNLLGTAINDSTIGLTWNNIIIDSVSISTTNIYSGVQLIYARFNSQYLNYNDLIKDSQKSILITGSYNNGNGYVVGFIIKAENPNVVGIENVTGVSDQIKIFPNPTTGNIFSVTLDDKLFYELKSEYNFCLYDSQGKNTLSINDIHTNKFEVSIEKFQKGSYYFSIISKNRKVASGKITVN